MKLATLGVSVAALTLLAMVSPAAGESRIEKDLALVPGGRFSVDSEVGSVTITGTERHGAHIVVTSDQDDLNSALEITYTSGAGWASVTARRKDQSIWSHRLSVHFEIEVPTETRTSVRTGGGSITLAGLRGDAAAKTSGGPIEVDGLDGSLEAHTSGGPIRLREVTGNAHISTSGGPITVQSLDGNLLAHTSGGGIRIDRVSGFVNASTSGGGVRVAYSPGDRLGGEIETSGGGIEVTLDPTVNLNLDASTSGGSVHSDLHVSGDVSRSHIHGSIGSGGEELRLHTSGGSIHIRAL